MRGSVIPATTVEAKVTATPTGETTGQAVTADTAGDGSFSFDLPEGTYELTGMLTDPVGGGYLTPETVLVHSGQTVNVDLYANYP